ncbi:uncharacterized protein LOC127148277 isoform X2 [Cucumis melo]|uniref:Uncharacterized protein LOC103491985 isoform X2 n=1 Tax=Cucumis melo TaxID=3656 RepID=A0ABM3KFZ6_CUCME|nr:uncharacterized protein LOC127145954 isoform X2 [Cucumis melo]XP_050936704.1 uncharacterized protein LOC127146102 isoform X2 [Cucumis melo]XP_050936768.1 uncharacterized protein LOC127147205 isoform X2 [Cucumis melo]XP_050936876.1 uncharacterized protein LOC103491985 isoform X2 [Cucumis melo]XP_050937665.1 uncharacterized protein LOC127148270 isoform X2 [Cucumis melo]XP_050937669.1 uncharacterized protein LOC127148271 isoform X2 [Cucumis melo]XP_050937673.1 uncharacterized protein LOC12714
MQNLENIHVNPHNAEVQKQLNENPFLFSSFSVGRSSLFEEIDKTHLEVPFNRNHKLVVKIVAKVKDEHKLFDEMRRRILSFKNHKYFIWSIFKFLQNYKSLTWSVEMPIDFYINGTAISVCLKFLIIYPCCFGVCTQLASEPIFLTRPSN